MLDFFVKRANFIRCRAFSFRREPDEVWVTASAVHLGLVKFMRKDMFGFFQKV